MNDVRKTQCDKWRGALRFAVLTATALPGVALASGNIAVDSDAIGARAHATLVGRLEAGRSVTVAILLPLSDAKGAAAFVAHVTRPGDPLFRHYISPVEYGERFGTRRADYAAVVAWAKASGLTPGEIYPAHNMLTVTGSTAAIEAALSVRFFTYKDPKGTAYFAADRTASLPYDIATKVSGVLGLSSANHFEPFVIVNQTSKVNALAGATGAGGYSAKDLRTAYHIPPQTLPNKTQTLAVFEQGGYFASDVAKYVSANRLPTIPVVPRSVNNYGSGVDDAAVELEAVLDIDMLIAMNPAAARIMVYEDGSDSFSVALLSSLAAMAKDDKATTISISYGMDEDYTYPAAASAENDALTQLAAQGQAVFVSTGDLGAYGDAPPGLHTTDPSTQPLVTAVGGTTMFLKSNGDFLAEEVWNDLPAYGATGGGISTFWPIPSYQPPIYGVTENGGSGTMRNTPDVAAIASPLAGVAVYSALQGGWVTVGGTSVSAPVWAGVYSLGSAASEALGFGTPGFANPLLYKMAEGEGFYYPTLNNILDGSNGDANYYGAPGYSAGIGYNNCTGLGSITAGDSLVVNIGIIPALFHGGKPPGTPRDIAAVPTSNSVTLSWSDVKNAGGYLVQGVKLTGNVNLPNAVSHTSPFVESGLTANSFYIFTVIAVGPNGTTAGAPIYIKTLK